MSPSNAPRSGCREPHARDHRAYAICPYTRSHLHVATLTDNQTSPTPLRHVALLARVHGVVVELGDQLVDDAVGVRVRHLAGTYSAVAAAAVA